MISSNKFIKKYSLFLKRENIYFILLSTIIFILDRISKIKIINNFNENIYVINDFINLNLIWNTGVGFGLLNFNSTLFYNLVTALVGLIITILLFISIKLARIDKIIFSMIIGGALGNLYDRLTFKAVPDFIDFHYENFHWFTFNVADIFISFGVICYLIRGLLLKKN